MNNVEMDNRWEELAREDAEFYIWTDLAPGDDFMRSGERDVERILAVARPFISNWGTALEIGCGVGRITIPMSASFATIVAVDIAPTMLAKLTAHCAARAITNVKPMLARDGWDRTDRVGFAYSRIVFQHIQSWDAISSYFTRIADCLASDGVFYLQFDTRPPNLIYHIKNRLPDALLPRTLRRGVRRIRRTSAQIRELASRNGLTTLFECGAGTLDNEFVFGRRARS